MPSPKDLKEREVQRRADVVNATIIQRNDDGFSYDCEDTRTKHVFRASPANRFDTFSPGTRVVVAPTGASRRTIGAGAVIVSRAPQEQRGITGVARIAGFLFGGAVITDMSPRPLRIPIGFTEPRTLTIRGFGMTASPTSYGAAEITENSAPTISSTVTTCDLVASASCPVGLWGVTVHGRTFPAALETYTVEDHLYITGYCQYDLGGGDSAGAVCLVGVRLSDLTVDRMLTGDTATNMYPTPSAANPLLLVEDVILALNNDESGDTGRLAVVSIDTDSSAWEETATLTGMTMSGAITLNGSLVAFIDGTSGDLYTCSPAGASLTQVNGSAITGVVSGVIWDGTYYWAGNCRITTAGTVAAVAGVSENWCAAASGGFVYIADLNTLRKVTAASATLLDSLSLGASTVAHSMVIHSGFLYVYTQVGTGPGTFYVRKYDLSTFTLTSSLDLSPHIGLTTPNAGLLAVSPDGTKLYALCRINGEATGNIKEITLASFTVTNTLDLDDVVTLPEWEATAIITA